MDDRAAMVRAIRLSRRGYPAPNPHVGCVIVRDGVIVGEGHHDAAGQPHAEAVALRKAGERATDATAYVTLEPCAHHGRTPPCADALIAAGIRRVVVAAPDPNPVASGGLEKLADAGVSVEVGLLQPEAEAANRRFLFAMRHRRPYVVVKSAIGLDGRIALASGESQWITGLAARRIGHRLRAESGAVLVGRATVEADNPQLTARIPGVRNPPTRIVLDPQGRLSGAERVFDDAAPTRWIKHEFDLPELLAEFFADGITGILVEGGGVTVGRFLEARLVDRLELFVAPIVLGDGPSWVRNLTVPSLAAAPHGAWAGIRRLGGDLWVSLDLS